MSEAAIRETRVPEWFPPWAARLSDLYFSGTTSMFVLHGNVQDLAPAGAEPEQVTARSRISSPNRSSAAGTWCCTTIWLAACGLSPRRMASV